MSETGKRNPDRLNMIGVVVVGICGAVMVYVSIALLQAFYMNDTSQVETQAEYGGQDSTVKLIRDTQKLNIDPPQGVKNPSGDTFSIKIDKAIDLVVADAQKDPAELVPSQGKSDRPTIQPIFGRPRALDAPAPASGSGAGSAATPPAGGGSGSAAAPGAGSGSSVSTPSPGGSPPPPSPRPAAGAGSGSGGHAP